MYFFLIMNLGLFIAERMSDNFNSDEFVKKYTYDSFTWNPLKVWKMFFWRLKTVEELAKDKINKEKEDEYKRNKEKAKLQKEQELEDAVNARVEELKAKNNQ
jgi:hypothetical protein